MFKEKLELRHKEILKPRLNLIKSCLSEYHFGTLFLFRRAHDYHLLFEGYEIWIEGKTFDGLTHLMPTKDISEFSSDYLLQMLEKADCLYPISSKWAEKLDESLFIKTYNRDDSDYIFQREKIAEYPGRHLSPKRNLLKQFLEKYEAQQVPFEEKYLKDALFVLDEWEKNFKGKSSDYHACKDGLELFEKLNLKGFIFYIENQPAAFVIGEVSLQGYPLIIHFAKALTQYKGIYPYIFQAFASDESVKEVCCLNWEQDLGEPGLRQSKESYQPDRIAHKFRISKRS